MEAIEKFKLEIVGIIEYLKNGLEGNVVFKTASGQEISITDIEYQLNVLYKLLYFLDLSYQEVQENHHVFISFPLVCSLLEETRLKNQEKMDVLFYIIEKNNASFQYNTTGNSNILDLTRLKELYSPNSSPEAFDKFMQKIDIQKLINSEESELSKQEAQIKKYLSKMLEESDVKNKRMIQMHNFIENHYLKKKDTYTEKDIQYVQVALKYLGVSDKDRTIIINNLKKNLKKRTDEVVEEKRPKEKPFDYQSAFLKVNEVMDLKSMFPKRSLTLEERIFYLALLTKMNVPKEERYLFLRNCEMLAYSNPIATYMMEYEKLKYYEEKAGLQQELAYLEELAQEIFLSSHEDYVFWKESMQNELKKIYSWIPKKFAYEEEEASKLVLK